MPVKKQEIYDIVSQLTIKLKATSIGEKLFEAARTHDGQKVKAVVDSFKQKHTSLYQSIIGFVKKYYQFILVGEIFDSVPKDQEAWCFDLDPASFFALTFLTGLDDCLFWYNEYDFESDKWSDSYTEYLNALQEKAKCEELSKFMEVAAFTQSVLKDLEESNYMYTNTCDLLADIFAGKLKNYYS